MRKRTLSPVVEPLNGEPQMKVAFATDDLKTVDAHFGWARHLAIYDVTPERHALASVVQFEGDLTEDGNEDKITPRLDALTGVTIVYVAAIGGNAAARVVRERIHPVKVPVPRTIESILLQLREVLGGSPPPWLRKALRADAPRPFADASGDA